MKTLLTLCGLLLLAGCASAGNAMLKHENSQTVAAKMKPGVTTEAQARAVFGDPAKTKYLSNGDVVWEYSYAHLESDAQNFLPIINLFDSGTHGYKKELVMEFGSDKVLKTYSLNKSQVNTDAGILG